MLFWLPGQWPDLNAYIRAERSNRFEAAALKRDYTDLAHTLALAISSEKWIGPVAIRCTWHMKNRRKDPDNVAFAIKFILDGLVEAGILDNDGQAQIRSLDHRFVVDSEEGVMVELCAPTNDD